MAGALQKSKYPFVRQQLKDSNYWVVNCRRYFFADSGEETASTRRDLGYQGV